MSDYTHFISLNDDGSEAYVGPDAAACSAQTGNVAAPIADSTFENIDQYAEMLERHGSFMFIAKPDGTFDHLNAGDDEAAGSDSSAPEEWCGWIHGR